MTPLDQAIPAVIEAYRANQKISVEHLAQVAGIVPQTYRRMLSHDCRLSTICAVNDALFELGIIGARGDMFASAARFAAAPRTPNMPLVVAARTFLYESAMSSPPSPAARRVPPPAAEEGDGW